LVRLASFVVGIGLITALSSPARANDWNPTDPALQACLSKANDNDLTMKDCYYDFAQREDVRMNANWHRLMANVGKKSDAGSALLAEQRAWLAYRDAACLNYAYGDGTLDRLLGASCYAKIVSRRADELADLVHYYFAD
jgi:uncharacterized protein YecT (DUF1311 family)